MSKRKRSTKLTPCEEKALVTLQAQQIKEKEARAKKRAKKAEEKQGKTVLGGQALPSYGGINAPIDIPQYSREQIQQGPTQLQQDIRSIGTNFASNLMNYAFMNAGRWNETLAKIPTTATVQTPTQNIITRGTKRAREDADQAPRKKLPPKPEVDSWGRMDQSLRDLPKYKSYMKGDSMFIMSKDQLRDLKIRENKAIAVQNRKDLALNKLAGNTQDLPGGIYYDPNIKPHTSETVPILEARGVHKMATDTKEGNIAFYEATIRGRPGMPKRDPVTGQMYIKMGAGRNPDLQTFRLNSDGTYEPTSLAKERVKVEQAKFIRESKLAAVLNRDAIRVKSNQAKAIDMFKQNVTQQPPPTSEQNQQQLEQVQPAEEDEKQPEEIPGPRLPRNKYARANLLKRGRKPLFVSNPEQFQYERNPDFINTKPLGLMPTFKYSGKDLFKNRPGYVSNDLRMKQTMDDMDKRGIEQRDEFRAANPIGTPPPLEYDYDVLYEGLGDFFERNATMQLNAPKKNEQFTIGLNMKPNPINFDAEKPFIKPDDAGFNNNAKPKTEGRKLLFSPNVPDPIELQTPNARTFSSTPSTANPQYGDSAQKFLNNKRSTREEMRSFLNSLSDFDNFLEKNPITPIAGKQKKTVTINQDIEMNTYTPAQKTPSNRYIDKIQASNTPGVWLSEADEINKVWDKAEQEEKTFNDATELYSGVNNLFKQNKPRDEFEQNPTRKAFYNDWYDKNMPGGNAIADTTVSESSTFSYPKTYVGPDLRVNEVEYPQFNNTIPDSFDELPLNIE